jgi:hypothetical protein
MLEKSVQNFKARTATLSAANHSTVHYAVMYIHSPLGGGGGHFEQFL